MSAYADDDDIPFPLLEKGDFVRLKEPYKPTDMMLDGPLQVSLARQVRDLARQHDEDGIASSPHPARAAYRSDTFEHLFQFTHGTVTNIVSRFPAMEYETIAGHVRQYDDTGGAPPRNVSLHLYNPETGLMYVGGHPSEPGKPEFVEHHIADLVLVHKHDQTWGNEYDLDIAEVYAEWGIEGLGIPREEADDGE